MLLLNITKNTKNLNIKTITNLNRNFNNLSYLLNANNKEEKIYNIATPIFYVNAVPHIGHLYTSVISDSIHRFKRDILKKESFLSTGTDEHGLKVQQAAQKQGINPKEFCDGVSPSFKKLDKLFNIDYSKFIRTSDENHKLTAQKIWKQLKETGYIYRDTYKGWYSIVDEAFYSSSEVEKVIDQGTGEEKMVSKSTKSLVEWTEEINYKFKLSQFAQKLLDYHLNSPKSILPQNRKQEVIDWINGGLEDLSISRSINRLQWGIPVPDDNSQIMYVWFEALINYLTVTGYPNPSRLLPTDLHIIGKDIIRFHAVYYPAILMALNLPLPTTLLTHGHWTMNNQKMSKSLGNVVDPINLVETSFNYDADPIRYYLLRDGGNFQMDGDWSNETLKTKVNKELNGQLGNLLSRVSGKKLNPKQVIPDFKDTEGVKVEGFDPLIKALQDFPSQFRVHFENYELGKSLQLSVDLLTMINKLIQDEAPWAYCSDSTQQQRLKFVIFYTYETLRILSTLLQPIMPTKMSLVLDVLNVEGNRRNWEFIGVGKGWSIEREGDEVKLCWDKLDNGRLFELVK